jgi:hypothetical protein
MLPIPVFLFYSSGEQVYNQQGWLKKRKKTPRTKKSNGDSKSPTT